MTGTRSSSASRTRSLEVRARSTPPPARITGRSAVARNWRTARTSSGSGSDAARAATCRAAVPAGSDLVEEVLGERRGAPGRAGRRAPARTASPTTVGRSATAVAAPARMAGQAADRRRLVDLLERLAAAERALDLADEGEHRRRVLARGVDPDREVGGADGARAERRRRPAGELAVGLRHERGRALVARGDDADPGRLEALEQAEEALAGHRERVADAGGPQGVGDEPADGPRAGLGRRVGGFAARRRARRPTRHRGRHLAARLRRAADSALAAPARRRDRVDGGVSVAFGQVRVGVDVLGCRLDLASGAASTRLRSPRPPASARPSWRPGRRLRRRPPRRRGDPSPVAGSRSRRPLVGHQRTSARRPSASDEAEDHDDGDDDHHDPGEPRAGHHRAATGSSRTGAGRALLELAQPADHLLELVLALARDADGVALDLRLDLRELLADQLADLLRQVVVEPAPERDRPGGPCCRRPARPCPNRRSSATGCAGPPSTRSGP